MYKEPIPQRYLALDYESESTSKEIQHCCKTMNNALENPNVGILYSPIYREYLIPLLYKGRTRGNINSLQGILYCPWCSVKLPKSVRNKWFDILEKEYQLDDPWDTEQKELIPKEFKTDEWWINRNL